MHWSQCQLKLPAPFSLQCVLIIEWQVKKPHTVVGILIPVSLSHGKQFQMGPALCRYNTASALWHGKNALSPSGSERAIEGQPGLLSARCWGFDRDTGWWVVVKRPAYYQRWQQCTHSSRSTDTCLKKGSCQSKSTDSTSLFKYRLWNITFQDYWP